MGANSGAPTSQKSKAGNPSDFNAIANAIVSASVDDVLTAVCPFVAAANGAKVRGPTSISKYPDVDLLVRGQPAKLASVYSTNRQSCR